MKLKVTNINFYLILSVAIVLASYLYCISRKIDFTNELSADRLEQIDSKYNKIFEKELRLKDSALVEQKKLNKEYSLKVVALENKLEKNKQEKEQYKLNLEILEKLKNENVLIYNPNNTSELDNYLSNYRFKPFNSRTKD